MAGRKKDVASQLYQQILPGWEHISKPKNESSDSPSSEQRGEEAPPAFWKSKAHTVSITALIEQTSLPDGQYLIELSFPDDVNLSLRSYSKRGKKQSKEISEIPVEKSRKWPKIHLVYGVSEDGGVSLPHFAKQETGTVVTQLFSQVLGRIDAASKRTILERKKQTANDDAGKRSKSTPTSKNVGVTKKPRGSKKIRNEVLPETVSKEASVLVEPNRQVLGSGSEND